MLQDSWEETNFNIHALNVEISGIPIKNGKRAIDEMRFKVRIRKYKANVIYGGAFSRKPAVGMDSDDHFLLSLLDNGLHSGFHAQSSEVVIEADSPLEAKKIAEAHFGPNCCQSFPVRIED